MEVRNFNNINSTPVRTKSWLGINDISISNVIVNSNKEFTNVKVKNVNENIKVERFNNTKSLPKNKEFAYGISEELILEAENNFNLGYIMTVKRGAKLEEPVILEFNMDENSNNLIDNIVICCEEDTKANILIKYKSLDHSNGYHNGICKIFTSKNSQIKVAKINLLNEHVTHFDSNLSDVQNQGKVDFIEVNLGAKESISNYHSELIGEKGETNLNSLYLGNDEKIIDINYVITHKGQYTKSTIDTKGALQDKSKKNFKGTIDFKKGAAFSKGAENEYCMMLSKEARAKAMPLLLCEEDNVSGEHSAASGKIDENKLFYLMSRGFSYEEAKILIVQATFNPIIDMIPDDEIRKEILSEVNRRLLNE